MTGTLQHLTIHVLNVWQTGQWYRQVFGFPVEFTSDGKSARFEAMDQQLIFVAHDSQADALGPRRLNSFLSDPPAFHLDIATADVLALFNRAIAHGAVPVADPMSDSTGRVVATLRDLNGILVRIVSHDSDPAVVN